MPEPEERKDDFSYKPIGDQNLQGKAEYNPNRAVSPDELIQKLYSLRVPEPTFKQDKADRLQRMGRVNQLGRGVSVLGDMLATGLGAPIKRRNPDNVTPSLVQSYLDNLDKYKAEKDANILRNYQKDIEDIRTGLSHSYREQATELAKQKQADWMKAKEADQRLNYAKWSADWDLNKRKAGETERHNKESERIAAIRANKPTSAEINANKPFDPVQVQDKYGNNLKLEQGEWDKLYQDALKDTKFMDENMKAEMSKFKDTPDGGVKQIARAYYDYKKRNEIAQSTKEAENRVRKERGISTEPVKQTISKPKTAPTTIDYSKIVF